MTEVNVFQHSEHLFGVGRITTYNFPQMAAKLCALNPFFSAGTMNYKYITETFF